MVEVERDLLRLSGPTQNLWFIFGLLNSLVLYGLAVTILLPNVLENGDGKAPTQETKFGFPQAERCLSNPVPCPLTYPDKEPSSST